MPTPWWRRDGAGGPLRRRCSRSGCPSHGFALRTGVPERIRRQLLTCQLGFCPEALPDRPAPGRCPWPPWPFQAIPATAGARQPRCGPAAASRLVSPRWNGEAGGGDAEARWYHPSGHPCSCGKSSSTARCRWQMAQFIGPDQFSYAEAASTSESPRFRTTFVRPESSIAEIPIGATGFEPAT